MASCDAARSSNTGASSFARSARPTEETAGAGSLLCRTRRSNSRFRSGYDFQDFLTDSACRTRFISRVRLEIMSCAFSAALRIAVIRAPCSGPPTRAAPCRPRATRTPWTDRVELLGLRLEEPRALHVSLGEVLVGGLLGVRQSLAVRPPPPRAAAGSDAARTGSAATRTGCARSTRSSSPSMYPWIRSCRSRARWRTRGDR